MSITHPAIQAAHDSIDHRAMQAGQQVRAYLEEGAHMTDEIDALEGDTGYFWADQSGLHWSETKPDGQAVITRDLE